jgi:hypothetical protein
MPAMMAIYETAMVVTKAVISRRATLVVVELG